MTPINFTSPTRLAEETRNIALRYNETDPHMLDMIESITWLAMQAALEDPEDEFNWYCKAWSAVHQSDLDGLDEAKLSRLQALVMMKSLLAANLHADGTLVDEAKIVVFESLTRSQ